MIHSLTDEPDFLEIVWQICLSANVFVYLVERSTLYLGFAVSRPASDRCSCDPAQSF